MSVTSSSILTKLKADFLYFILQEIIYKERTKICYSSTYVIMNRQESEESWKKITQIDESVRDLHNKKMHKDITDILYKSALSVS